MPDVVKIRNQLNKWMDEDQSFSNPKSRESFQTKIWPYIISNIDVIMIDTGEDDDGNYPSSCFAAWLLVQHMDAFPDRQRKFLSILSAKVPKHIKLQFLKDRVKVNQWIMSNYNKKKYYVDGKPLNNPTVAVRDPNKFADAGIRATSRQQAIDEAIKAKNFLLVDAVKATGAKTQPSYTQQ